MASKEPFRVLIAGGGIAGLALANMLQKQGIDYLVLEAYPDITPQAGSTIGVLSHGCRILDQLGMYQDFLKMGQPMKSYNFRDDKGELLNSLIKTDEFLVQRHGYPLLFLDRRLALEILHSHVDKSKVLTKKAVTDVKLLHDGVKVTTQDGSVYSADILIGCDGIHSKVRREMTRLANEESPGYFPAGEADNLPCDYGCVFGISNPFESLSVGSFDIIQGYNRSYIIFIGPKGRVFWFCFFKLEGRASGGKIPRFSKEDEARHTQARENDTLFPGLKFGDIVKKKITSSMTAIPEYTFQRWHYDKIMTIGDAAHKFHPITAYGGASALESAACLTNGLMNALKQSDSGRLTSSQVSAVFQKVQDTRHAQVKAMISTAHNFRRVQALETPLLGFIARHVVSRLPRERAFYRQSTFYAQAQTLENAELPPRPLLVPYHSDLLSSPYNRGLRGWLLAAVFFALSALGYWSMHIWAMGVGASLLFEKIRVIPFTNNESLDQTLSLFPPQFGAGNKGLSAGHSALQMYFLISLFPLIALYTVESVRKRNSFNLLTFTSFWALYQALGIAVVGPLYYAAYLFSSSDIIYWCPVTREVPARYAKTLLPALLIGYLLPTILLFIPYTHPHLADLMILNWQPSPLYVNILLTLFSRVYGTLYPDDPNDVPQAAKPPPDLPSLNSLYIISFLISVGIHISTIFTALTTSTPALSLSAIFLPGIDTLTAQPSLTEGIRVLWLADFWVFWAATMVWCVVAVWDMNRVGRSRVDLGKAIAAILLGTVAVGPAATVVGVWYWREGKMARVLFK
ncbi:hypothetical protein AJ79_01063 [Helicocarpus griseus UAMH5409]|uniref:FAD-binding domain-containing protein n=1 Tax=Helicocarpus griseus UAMH5409 TaxID=1447875 RepID=A0A2B7Y8V2_9EURO|nr:hypothetical protein AJ79_01063 [Helicocarpus griseus UAMH5409]